MQDDYKMTIVLTFWTFRMLILIPIDSKGQLNLLQLI